MEFDYSEEQLALQDTLQRFVARDYDFDKRKAVLRSELGYSADAWQQYAELGLLALPLPEEFGGLGGSGVDVMVVMEQFGRGLLMEPYLSSVVLCGGLLRDATANSLKESLLPKVADGSVKMALACYEAAGRYDLAYVACAAQPVGDGWRLSGRKTVVLDAPSADFFLVSARNAGGSSDAAGICVFLVPKDAKGLKVSGYATQIGARAADLSLDNVAVGKDALIGGVGAALPLIRQAVDRGIAALCAEAVGVMDALNTATLDYLKTRKQFGVAIGTFQALKHRMADMLIAAEQSRSMAVIAAVSVDASQSSEKIPRDSRSKMLHRPGGSVGRAAGSAIAWRHGCGG